MAVKKNTLWQNFLQPIFQLVIDTEQLKQLYENIDWKQEGDRLTSPNIIYPHYYTAHNFHGVEGGYLNPSAAIYYDPITQYALAPNETWVRQELIQSIAVKPRSILDLGCGTGSMTLMLKQAFPQAEVVGLDLSPYMLILAEKKAQQAGLDIQWRHGKAEATGFAEAQFDLIAISFLFHETPAVISNAILRECFRLLSVGGQIAVLDGNQKNLRHAEWLKNIFEEPLIQEYAEESIDASMGAAGFRGVQTEDIWLLHQVTRGFKPIYTREPDFKDLSDIDVVVV